jgi:RNA polymerase sigma factor (sigma-70 family)
VCDGTAMTAISSLPCPAAREMDSARSGSVVAASEPGLQVALCLKRVRCGDEDAARSLIQHLYPLVIKLVRSHLPRRTSEEDLAQTVFMKMFANLDQYSGTVPLEHWVSRIAVNTCLNQLRVEKVRPEIRYADLTDDESDVLDLLANSGEELHPAKGLASRELLEKMLERLNPEDRMVVQLLHVEEHSVEEVRKLTGWNTSLIKVRAFRARHKLRKHLSKLLQDELP